MQLASIGEESVKDKRIYTDLLQNMAFSKLKPTVYEQVELPHQLAKLLHKLTEHNKFAMKEVREAVFINNIESFLKKEPVLLIYLGFI